MTTKTSWFTLYYHADGNGNITSLISYQEAVSVTYRYDPYGNLVSSSGSWADDNTYRFSSKETDRITGQYYYGYRFYDPYPQRWLNRDPISEAGFTLLRMPKKQNASIGDPNQFLFVANNPINHRDSWGLMMEPGLLHLPPAHSRCQPPDPCTSRGGHYEPYWKVMEYDDIIDCMNAEKNAFRDVISGILWSRLFRSHRMFAFGALWIPHSICSMPICVYE